MGRRATRERGGERGAVRCLTVLASPDRRAVGGIHLLGMSTYIGREPAEPELVWISDPALAPRHCRVRRDPQGYFVEAVAGAGLLRVDGAPPAGAALRDGQIVRSGDTLFLFGPLDLPAVRWAHPRLSGMLGWSGPQVRAHMRACERATAPAPGVPFVVLGPPGAGRAMLAWELHRQRGGCSPLLVYDCAACAAERHRLDLFGGGGGRAPGLLARLGLGTLFLAEAQHLAADAAGLLLRSLGEARRSGSVWPQVVIGWDPGAEAAASAEAAELSALGAADAAHLPALALRRADILPLFEGLLLRQAPSRGGVARRGPSLAPDLQEALLLAPWPGNGDDLRRTAARLLQAAGPTSDFGPQWAGIASPAGLDAVAAAEGWLPAPPAEGERPSPEDLRRLWDYFEGRVRRVAGYLGRDRSLVYRWLRQAALLARPRGAGSAEEGRHDGAPVDSSGPKLV